MDSKSKREQQISHDKPNEPLLFFYSLNKKNQKKFVSGFIVNFKFQKLK
jgi:hypothetical protein